MSRRTVPTVLIVLALCTPLWAQSETASAPASSPAPAGGTLAVGIDLYQLANGFAQRGWGFELPVEVALDPAWSVGSNLYLLQAHNETLAWSYAGMALWARWYLLNDGLTAPAKAPAGLFVTLGADADIWWGTWPEQDLGCFNPGIRLGLGYKAVIVQPKPLGIFLEPLLAYTIKPLWGGHFCGGLSLGVVF